jgi:predicted RNA-binding protein with PUA-like domain
VKYWLLKSEPDTYGIDRLAAEGETIWDGVRNYQARNFLRSMAIGDRGFFYHSNTNPPGIVGTIDIIEVAIVDPTQFDPDSDYYDPKSTPESPRWQTVKVKFDRKFDRLISLTELRERFAQSDFLVIKPGNRLSVMPVSLEIAKAIEEELGIKN